MIIAGATKNETNEKRVKFSTKGTNDSYEKKVKIEESTKSTFQEIKKEDYELYKPTKKINAVLVLFGGYPEVAEDIKREFKILEIAKNNNVAVIF